MLKVLIIFFTFALYAENVVIFNHEKPLARGVVKPGVITSAVSAPTTAVAKNTEINTEPKEKVKVEAASKNEITPENEKEDENLEE